ncbi:MAG: SIS domain-containing protein [Chitinophagaceae bacterium]|nr:SIS domain-containing protein [Chitinophagaceae bacterium]
MQIDSYRKAFDGYFSKPDVERDIKAAVDLIKTKARSIFFLGNGGSNSICSHMMEDFMKLAGYPTYSFSDAALITCFANDFGYERAMAEWLKVFFTENDVLVAISSSGESKNILNAVSYAKSKGGKVITLSGFKNDNSLKRSGDINFHIDVSSYGIAECYHQVILHIILDSLND